MTNRLTGVALGLALLFGCAPAGDKPKTERQPAGGAFQSGHQLGENLGVPFEPLNLNGPAANEKACLV